MCSFPVITHNSLYNILAHSSHFKQAAVIVFHSHLLLVLAPTFSLFNFARKFWFPVSYIKLCTFIDKQFRIDSFPWLWSSSLGFRSSQPDHSNRLVKSIKKMFLIFLKQTWRKNFPPCLLQTLHSQQRQIVISSLKSILSSLKIFSQISLSICNIFLLNQANFFWLWKEMKNNSC